MRRAAVAVLAFLAAGVLAAPGASAATAESVPAAASTRVHAVETALADLGLLPGKPDRRWDAYSDRAACTWRHLTGRHATMGRLDADEQAALLAAAVPLAPRGGMVIGVNVNRVCQTAVWVVDRGGDRAVKAVFPVSTGMSGHATPTGTFTVARRINGWHESTKYTGAMMYRPIYFNAGIALHGSITDAYVQPHRASHGCTRMLHRDIDRLWAAGFGTGDRVRVYDAP